MIEEDEIDWKDVTPDNPEDTKDARDARSLLEYFTETKRLIMERKVMFPPANPFPKPFIFPEREILVDLEADVRDLRTMLVRGVEVAPRFKRIWPG